MFALPLRVYSTFHATPWTAFILSFTMLALVNSSLHAAKRTGARAAYNVVSQKFYHKNVSSHVFC